jgi:hypothetical protein
MSAKLSGNNMKSTFPNESGIYKAILKTVRKNGMYSVDYLLDNPDVLLATIQNRK